MKQLKRNGDWNIKYISKKEFEKMKANGVKHTSPIFAEGEATNHFHAVKTKTEKDFELIKLPDGSYLMKLEDDAVITHPEHSLKVDLEVQKGYAILYKGREKNWFSLATKKIVD